MKQKPSYEELEQRVKQLEKIELAYEQSERKLHQAEQRSRAWLENSPVCTKMLDLDFNLQYMSSAGAKALKIKDSSSLYGKAYPFFWYCEQYQELTVKNMQLALSTKQVKYQEGAIEDNEGNELWYHSSIVPVADNTGRVEYIIVVSVDITARKQAEIKLVEHKQHLEEKIEQRTAELRQSQKMEALGTLAGGIAHDFNNILAAILGQAELCLHILPPDSEANYYLESITRSGNRAADLVRQIMTFSRMDSTNIKTLNLAQVVTKALSMVGAISPANIEIRQNLLEPCPSIQADETQIHQIILNLCSNANHAMGESGGMIEITLEHEHENKHEPGQVRQSEQQNWLILRVKDSGQGIADKQQARIFEPFYTTKEIGKGTGLGLSVVHGIMQSHQGKIKVTSKLGQGTSFSLHFPVTAQTVQQETQQTQVATHGTGHLMIVEDDPLLIFIYRQFLESNGYRVTVANNGLDALEKFKHAPDSFDLVITDNSMPKMTGIELVPQLLNIRENMPVMLISGHGKLMSDQQAHALGVAKYLHKPIKLTTFKASIDACLQDAVPE
jgi:PAS domain S-box-containing protein